MVVPGIVAVKRHTVGTLLVLVAAACFGTLAIFGKLAEARGLNVTTLLTYRFLIGSTLVWGGLVVSGRARVLPRKERRIALGLGVIYGTFSGLFFWGLLFVPAGVAGIVFYTYPITVYVIAVTLLDESLTSYKLTALVLALFGVGLIIGVDTADVNAFGAALVLLAALGYAIYIAGNRAALASIEADLLTGTAMIATTVLFLGFGLASGRLSSPTDADQLLVVVGIAVVGTAIPILLYVRGLDRIPASNASILSTIEPVVTVILGIAVLGERLTLPVILGGVCVLASVALVHSDISGETNVPQ